MESTHTWGGVNYADAFHMAMTLAGGALMLFGLIALALPLAKEISPAVFSLPAGKFHDAR